MPKLSCLNCRFADILCDESLWCEAMRFFKQKPVTEITDLEDENSVPIWCPLLRCEGA